MYGGLRYLDAGVTILVACLGDSVLKYRVIQEERSIFLVVIVLVLARKKLSNSEWLPG